MKKHVCLLSHGQSLEAFRHYPLCTHTPSIQVALVSAVEIMDENGHCWECVKMLMGNALHLQCSAVPCLGVVFCVRLLSTFVLPVDITLTCPATLYHYKPWQSPHRLQLVTLASWHHTPAIWANCPTRNWLYLSLLISRVNLNMGS